LIEDTENSPGDDRYDVTLDQVIPAVEPVAPSSPQVLAIVGLGLIAGFAIGAIVAVYRTTTNRRLRTISDVRRAAGLPVIGRIPRRARLAPVGPHDHPDIAQEAAYEDAISSLSTLGGPEASRFVLIPVTVGSIDGAVLHGFLSAFAAAGRRACVLDLRVDTKPEANVRSLADILDHVPPGTGSMTPPHPSAVSAVYAMTTRIPRSTLEGEIPAAVVRLGLDFDVVIVVTPPAASALIEATVQTGAGVVIGIRHNATSATDLVAIANRLRVMNVRPLGVLMTHVGRRAVGVAAETWRESDRNEILPVDAPESLGDRRRAAEAMDLSPDVSREEDLSGAAPTVLDADPVDGSEPRSPTPVPDRWSREGRDAS